MAKTPEAKVKTKIKTIVSKYGKYSTTFQSGYGSNGTSDALCCVAGAFVAIEAKADKTKRPTPLQRVYLREVVESGGYGFIIDADNLHLLEAFVRSLHTQAMGCVLYTVDDTWRLKTVDVSETPRLIKLLGDAPTDIKPKKKRES